MLREMVGKINLDHGKVKETEVKVTRQQENYEIEAYLKTFERVMSSYEIPKDRWSFRLAPQLIAKAQQVYVAMDAAEAGDYDKLKAAILRRYGINEESYRQQFRKARKRDKSNKEFGIRLGDLVEKWVSDCTTLEQVKDRIIMEQLVDKLSDPMKIYVHEHKLKSSGEAGELADDYIQARGSELEVKRTKVMGARDTRKCHN